MRKNFKKINKKALPTGRRGFSFVEVMLVVFILSTSLVVFVQVISKSIDHSLESRDSIIAAGLAQEGVELVKNIRDNNWAQKITAFSGMNSGSYAINYNGSALISLGTGKLKWNNGYYNTSSGNDSKFSRKIVISGSGEMRIVTSYVIWEGSSFPTSCNVANKCVYVIITLTKWGDE